MDKVVKSLEGLLWRSIAPSVTFFVVAGAVDLLFVELLGGSPVDRIHAWFLMLRVLPDNQALVTVACIFLVIGASYALSSLQQVFFDNLLKRNFDPSPRLARWSRAIASEGLALAELRAKVIERLREEPLLEGLRPIEELTDYVLYEILGGIDETDTRGFVDAAKALGIAFASGIVALFVMLVLHWEIMTDAQRGAFTLGGLLLAAVLYAVGFGATRAQYRARALRLYVNFLVLPPERLHRRLHGLRAPTGDGDDDG